MGGKTVIVLETYILESAFKLAVIVAVPTPLAYIFPPLTVATLVLLLSQTTAAFDGVVLTDQVQLPPLYTVVEAEFQVIVGNTTFTCLETYMAESPCKRAVIVAVPVFLQDIVPLFTVATPGLSLVQVTAEFAGFVVTVHV